MNFVRVSLVLACSALLAESAFSNEIKIHKDPARKLETFELHSATIGEDYRIHVALPLSYAAGDKRYPVLYLLDADLMFGMTSELTRLLPGDMIEPGMPEVILVGIGYVESEWWAGLRTRDLTPEGSAPKEILEMTDHLYPFTQQSGGADDFLAFIETQLDPMVRKQYRSDGGRAGILGDSFGGLFTYYAFLKQSRLFDKYWMGSPGLIQEDSKLLDGLPALLRRSDFKGQRIYISVGERELSHSSLRVLGRNYTGMVGIFEDYPGKDLSVKAQIFPGATHNTVIPYALTEALRYLYAEER